MPTAALQPLTMLALLQHNLQAHQALVAGLDSARIQAAHIFIGHTWCGQIEQALGRVPPA